MADMSQDAQMVYMMANLDAGCQGCILGCISDPDIMEACIVSNCAVPVDNSPGGHYCHDCDLYDAWTTTYTSDANGDASVSLLLPGFSIDGAGLPVASVFRC